MHPLSPVSWTEIKTFFHARGKRSEPVFQEMSANSFSARIQDKERFAIVLHLPNFSLHSAYPLVSKASRRFDLLGFSLRGHSVMLCTGGTATMTSWIS